MKPHTRRKLYAAGVIVVLVVTVWRVGPWSLRKPAAPKAAPEVAVDIATVTRRDIPVFLEGLGTVQAFYTVTVTARVDGQIDRVAFVEGQEVRKGALLAQIDPRPYRAALDQAMAARAKDQAQLANARLDLERYALLAPEDLASKQTVDTQRSLVAQLQAQVASDTASIDSARTQLDYTSITAPIDGRTGIRQVDPGNNVHAADTTGIVVLTQLHPISVIFSLPEDAYGDLSAALRRGPVEATALSRNHQDELDRGTVALIDMTLTSAACPLTDVIEDQTLTALVGAGLVNEARINWVWNPPWGPDKITEDGREQLRALGFTV